MSNYPDFSVIMSVYHGEDTGHFMAALETLCEQSLPATQIVIVQDGPLGADLHDVIREYSQRLPITSVSLAKNSGLAAALNFGLQYCEHDLVARADSDDLNDPTRFEKQISYMSAHPEVGILGSYIQEIAPDGSSGRIRTAPTTNEAILRNIWASPMLHPTVVYRRKTILALGGYRTDLRRGQDYDLWLRAAKAGLTFAAIPEPLVLYRFSEENLAKRQSIKDVWRRSVIGAFGTRQLGLPLWKQAACFLPVARALLPAPLQLAAYRLQERVDPRRRT